MHAAGSRKEGTHGTPRACEASARESKWGFAPQGLRCETLDIVTQPAKACKTSPAGRAHAVRVAPLRR
eukprot:11913544-Alexandrium_andersonii.AAC.1